MTLDRLLHAPGQIMQSRRRNRVGPDSGQRESPAVG
jgi:hypothetical protein